MGMMSISHGNTQDEVARIFQLRVQAGEFVKVGFDLEGEPLFMNAETARGKLFKGLDVVQSRILNAFVRKGGLAA